MYNDHTGLGGGGGGSSLHPQKIPTVVQITCNREGPT